MLHVQTELRASTLAGVLEFITEALSKLAVNVPIQIGKNYLKHFGVGNPPKIIFVPESPGGSIGDPFMAGMCASYLHSCDVYVRAEPGPTDVLRFAPLYELVDKVVGTIAIATTGKHEWGTVSDASPLATDGCGCGTAFSFRYRRDIAPYDDLMRFAGPFEDATKAIDSSSKVTFQINPTTQPSED
jgi:hypothetical protein